MTLRTLLFPILLFSSHLVIAQIPIYDGDPYDSTVIDLSVNANDTFIHFNTDTSLSHSWQIGNTNKPFFADSGVIRAIMTDTVNSYATGLNDWFTIAVNQPLNVTIDFWHKYQTSSGKDGGV